MSLKLGIHYSLNEGPKLPLFPLFVNSFVLTYSDFCIILSL